MATVLGCEVESVRYAFSLCGAVKHVVTRLAGPSLPAAVLVAEAI